MLCLFIRLLSRRWQLGHFINGFDFFLPLGHQLADGRMRVDEHLYFIFLLNVFKFMDLLSLQGCSFHNQLLDLNEFPVIIMSILQKFVIVFLILIIEDGYSQIFFVLLVFLFHELVD